MKFPRIQEIGLDKLWALVVLVGVFIFVNTQPIRPHDFWWHIAVGKEIIQSGAIPTHDVYSFTMLGTPYPSFQAFWLADIFLYSVFEAGGPALIVFVQSLVITCSYGLLLILCWRVSKSWRIAALAVLFAAALGINNWNVRPQTISYLLGVIFLVAIYSFREKPKYLLLAVFPLCILVWVNSHGSFVIGLVLIGIWLGDEIWQLGKAWVQKTPIELRAGFWGALIALISALLACLVNPRGLEIINYLGTLLGDPVIQNLVPEWAAPRLDDVFGAIFLGTLFLSAIVMVLPDRRPTFFQLMTILVFGILGLRTMRGAVWFGIVMAPVIANHLSHLRLPARKARSAKPRQSLLSSANLLIILLVVLGMVVSLPWFKDYLPFPRLKAGLISSETPLGATEFIINKNPQGKLFNELGFGSYIIWAARPRQVFIDPRIELYPAENWGDYITISNALPGWEEVLEEYGIQTLMLNPETQPDLIEKLRQDSGWGIAYEDQTALVFVYHPY